MYTKRRQFVSIVFHLSQSTKKAFYTLRISKFQYSPIQTANSELPYKSAAINRRIPYNSIQFHRLDHILLFSQIGQPSTEWLNDWLVPVRWWTVDSIKASLHNDHGISIIHSPEPQNRKIMLIFIWRRAESMVTAVVTVISFGSILIVQNEQCDYFMRVCYWNCLCNMIRIYYISYLNQILHP